MKVVTKLCILTIVFVIMFTSGIQIRPAYAFGTTLFINPKTSNTTLGQPFNVTVEVQNATDLSSWQLELFFDPAVLACTHYEVPPDNIFGYNIINPPPQIDNASGRIWAFCARDSLYGVNGSGILAKIEFQTKIVGIGVLDIRNEMTEIGTYLLNSLNNQISFTATDGTAKVTGQNFQENPYPITYNSTQYTIIIYTNSTVTSFNYTNPTQQPPQQIKYLATGTEGTNGSATAIIPKALMKLPYAIVVNGYPTYFTYSENATHAFVHFTYAHSTKEIKILSTVQYDLNGDRVVNMLELYFVAIHYGETPSSPNWTQVADINRDGVVNMLDLYAITVSFGNSWIP